MNWVITGGCGFIGRGLIAALLENGSHCIRVVDNLSTGTREDLGSVSDFDEPAAAGRWSPGISLFVSDILDREALDKILEGADVVVHLAANTGVPQSVEDPVQDCQTNVNGTLNILEACRNAGVRRMVFASSGAPLGEQTPPLHEEMAPHPASPYGASKLAGEAYCSAYFHCFNVETVVLRFGNVYGEGSAHKGSVVAKFIKEALAGQELEIYGDGGQTRDFIHISDLVNAIRKSAEVSEVGGETFQIATAYETTVGEMTEKLLRAMEAEGLPRAKTFHGPERNGDVRRNFSDTTKAQQLLGWQPEVELEEGLRRTVRFFLEQQ